MSSYIESNEDRQKLSPRLLTLAAPPAPHLQIVDSPALPAGAPKLPSARFYRWRWVTLLALNTIIFAFLFVRTHAAVTMPQILRSTGLTKSQFGIVYSCGYFAQSVGKLVNGVAVDRFGGKKMLLVSLMGAIAMSVAFALVGWQNVRATSAGSAMPMESLLTMLTVLWSGIRYFQSSAWGAILKILPHWYREASYGRVLGLFSLSYGLGDALVRLLLGVMISITAYTWFEIWWISSGIAFMLGIPCFWLIQDSPLKIGEPEPPVVASTTLASARSPTGTPVEYSENPTGSQPEAPVTPARRPFWVRMRPILTSSRFWMVLIMYVCLTFVRETFLGWTAQFLTDRLQLSTSSAGISSLVVPLFSALSAMSGGILIDHVKKQHKEYVPAGYLLLCLFSLISMSLVTEWKVENVPLSLFLLSCIAFGLEAPYSFMDGIYTLQLAGKESAALTVGIIQAAGNLGAIASGYLIGVVAELFGWGVMMMILTCSVGIVTLMVLVDIWKKRWQMRRSVTPLPSSPRP